MGRFWTILFLLTPILGVGVFVLAPGYQHWLPKLTSVEGASIDHLFYLILGMTGIVFVATELTLAWCVFKYDAKRRTEPVKYTHGEGKIELLWTVMTGLALVFLVLYQDSTGAIGFSSFIHQGLWEKRTSTEKPFEVEVIGRRFEWRTKYPGPDGKFDTEDDLHDVNDLHVPVNREVLVHLKSQDVIHSFFLPNLRVKQDAVPGMTIPVPFTPSQEGSFDVVCAELCGWGHYIMKGRLTVQNDAELKAFMDKLQASQEAVQ